MFNKIVPQSVFRCRRFVIFQLVSNGQPFTTHPDILIRPAISEAEIVEAESLSGFCREESTGQISVMIAISEGDVIGALWYSTRAFDESGPGLRITLDDGQTWLFSAFVQHDFRRRGIYRQLVAGVVGQQGSADFLLAINPDNRRSMAAHKNLGVKEVAHVFAMRMFSAVFCCARRSAFGSAKPNRRWTGNHRQNPVLLRIELD